MLDRVEIHECNYNWKSFIEVYLEDYHVGPFHPGLGNFVTCDDLKWEFAPWASVQSVGISSLGKPGTQDLRALAQGRARLLPRRDAEARRDLAHLLPERHARVVSARARRSARSFRAASTGRTNIVEFYYPEDIALFEREFVEAEQAAYLETAREDDEIAERMDAGRRALYKQGRSEVGPYQSPMEDGMQHFHEFLRRELDPSHRCRVRADRASVHSTLMLNTLISTADLAHLDDPSFVIVDVRHDLRSRTRGAKRNTARGHIPGARFAHMDRDLSAPKTGTNGRHPLPVAGNRGRALRPPRHRRSQAGRRLRSGRRHVRAAAVVDAALARPRRGRRARRRVSRSGCARDAR